MLTNKNSLKREKSRLAIWMEKWHDKKTEKLRHFEIQEHANVLSNCMEKDMKTLAIGPDLLLEKLLQNGFDVSVAEISRSSTLPLPCEFFDLIVCSVCIKKLDNPLKILNEMHRVLKPDGIVLIIDMYHNATNESIKSRLNNFDIKGLERYIAKLSFKTLLKKFSSTKEDVFKIIEQTSFKGSKFSYRGIGLEVWLYKGSLVT